MYSQLPQASDRKFIFPLYFLVEIHLFSEEIPKLSQNPPKTQKLEEVYKILMLPAGSKHELVRESIERRFGTTPDSLPFVGMECKKHMVCVRKWHMHTPARVKIAPPLSTSQSCFPARVPLAQAMTSIYQTPSPRVPHTCALSDIMNLYTHVFAHTCHNKLVTSAFLHKCTYQTTQMATFNTPTSTHAVPLHDTTCQKVFIEWMPKAKYAGHVRNVSNA